jgi:hypothetical protein
MTKCVCYEIKKKNNNGWNCCFIDFRIAFAFFDMYPRNAIDVEGKLSSVILLLGLMTAKIFEAPSLPYYLLPYISYFMC